MPSIENNIVGGAEIIELTLQSMLAGSEVGVAIELKDIYSEINIYEDLFTNTLSGNIIVIDTVNLLSKMPVVGYEVIKIKYKTAMDFSDLSEDGIKTLTFRVSGISPRSTTSNRKTEIYTINLVSEVFYNDLTRKVNKSYSGNIQSTVKSIFDSYIVPYDMNFSDYFPKPILDINSNIVNDYKCIIPGWSPFRSINWLLSKAFSSKKYTDVSFLLYQDSNTEKFIITTLNDLFDNSLISQVYYYGDVFANQNTETGERNRTNIFNIAHKLSISNTFNILDNISSGLYSGSVYSHDLIKKEIRSDKYSYNDFAFTDKSTKDEKYPVLPNINELVFAYDSNTFFVSNRDSLNEKGEQQDIEKYKDRLLQRKSLFNQSQLFKIKFICLGDSTRKVGEKVLFVAPPLGNINPNTDSLFDQNLSGEYLITAIHHKITLDQYQMVVELSRNYLASPIPSETKLEIK